MNAISHFKVPHLLFLHKLKPFIQAVKDNDMAINDQVFLQTCVFYSINGSTGKMLSIKDLVIQKAETLKQSFSLFSYLLQLSPPRYKHKSIVESSGFPQANIRYQESPKIKDS